MVGGTAMGMVIRCSGVGVFGNGKEKEVGAGGISCWR